VKTAAVAAGAAGLLAVGAFAAMRGEEPLRDPQFCQDVREVDALDGVPEITGRTTLIKTRAWQRETSIVEAEEEYVRCLAEG
jgi:hypothetical protein